MKWLINYIRSCFCKHKWKCLGVSTVWGNSGEKYPLGNKYTYFCKKYGTFKVYKNF